MLEALYSFSQSSKRNANLGRVYHGGLSVQTAKLKTVLTASIQEKNNATSANKVFTTQNLGTTMYMTCGISCADCARAIINSGVSKIVLRRGRGATNEKWQDSAKRSEQMFKEAGIVVEYFDL